MHQLKSILVPVDYSAHADHALEYAATLARQFKARLLVVHVAREFEPSRRGWVPETTRERNEAARLSAHAARVLGRSAIRYEAAALSGDPAQRIVEMARARACDLIVMGTEGRTGWKRLLLGSVAEKVVRYAPCPVLAVRPRLGSHRPPATGRKTRGASLGRG